MTVWAYMLERNLAATRAVFIAAGIHPTETDASRLVASQIEPGNTLPNWDTERTVVQREQLSVGDCIEFAKTISEADVQQFAAASGDTNPLHLDDGVAEKTRFGGRIVHGTLVSGLISAALARLPGLPIYFSQDLEFHNPARVGDRVTATCEIVEELDDDQYRLSTRVVEDSDVLVDGEAIVLIDPLPEDSIDDQGELPAESS
ncbi:MaoC family dehydratase (plasmid) [Haloarcula sp. JP-L23]|nr:MaoC family dehydratase [Haloarcula sp. JP-L23]